MAEGGASTRNRINSSSSWLVLAGALIGLALSALGRSAVSIR